MTDRLTRDEEILLIEAAQRGDHGARQRVIETNTGLCWRVAHKSFRPRWMDVDDLALEGILGLDHAIDKFDTTRGLKFSTYATWWVRQAIRRKLEKTMYDLYTPTFIFERVGKIRKLRRQLQTDLRREPTVDEIIDASELTREQVLDILPLDIAVSSIEDRTNGDDDSPMCLGNILRDPVDYASQVEQPIWIEQCLEVLPERLREILVMRYGLRGTPVMTLKEVAKLKRRSREAIRKQEEKALRILRAHVEGREEEANDLLHA